MIKHLSQTLQHIGTAINSITQDSIIGKWVLGLGSMAAAFLAPIQYLLMICFAATIVDMFCGFRVARKFKQKIESGKNWSGTLRKLIDEFTILCLAHGLEWAVMDESGVFVLTGGATVIITLTEMWSILENLNTVDPNGPWKLLGKFLKRKGEDYTGVELDEHEHTDDHHVGHKPRKRRH